MCNVKLMWTAPRFRELATLRSLATLGRLATLVATMITRGLVAKAGYLGSRTTDNVVEVEVVELTLDQYRQADYYVVQYHV
ncbi:hypothetical protein FOL47_003182 [Perkinsus chesapeaki]|uniref:Uncharacterized protein n=1 Tax=Perkinsus chesapeaki TaxID=330153 RepID=A0A7J6KMD6_PERCH|nr:hypothetical protein FOL47_003182 [Perkinsus chesapeaki]